MLSRIGRPHEALYAVAESQQGYFTTAQAREAGYQDSTHPYHAKTGDWIREWRGIYLLDLSDAGEVPEDILLQAGREALKRDLITRVELKKRKAKPEQKRFLAALGETGKGIAGIAPGAGRQEPA